MSYESFSMRSINRLMTLVQLKVSCHSYRCISLANSGHNQPFTSNHTEGSTLPIASPPIYEVGKDHLDFQLLPILVAAMSMAIVTIEMVVERTKLVAMRSTYF